VEMYCRRKDRKMIIVIAQRYDHILRFLHKNWESKPEFVSITNRGDLHRSRGLKDFTAYILESAELIDDYQYIKRTLESRAETNDGTIIYFHD
jgi:hypothetical protein